MKQCISKKELTFRRYFVFVLGLFIISLGVSMATKSGLGSSPVTSVPYSLSLILPFLTIGNWSIVINLALVAAQWVLLKGRMRPFDIGLQLFATFIFGYFVDFSMFLLQWLEPGLYLLRILCLISGCAVLALGVSFQLMAGVAMLPPESFVKLVAQLIGNEYGNIKVVFDLSMSGIAAVLCLLFRGQLDGVREGTLIAALLVGTIAKFYGRHNAGLKALLLPEEN